MFSKLHLRGFLFFCFFVFNPQKESVSWLLGKMFLVETTAAPENFRCVVEDAWTGFHALITNWAVLAVINVLIV